jgi:hypothetical protein
MYQQGARRCERYSRTATTIARNYGPLWPLNIIHTRSALQYILGAGRLLRHNWHILKKRNAGWWIGHHGMAECCKR